MRFNLKNARCNKKLSQSDVARKCEISERTYQRIEKGTREPTGSVLCDLADLFNMSHRELLAKTDEA